VTDGAPPARLLPARPFPPYAFVSPHWPHPVEHPDGHSRGRIEAPAEPLDPADWRRSQDYLFGFDLWNHGYYWEAHEAWEGLWRVNDEPAIDALLRGLIKLAAAGVKVRQRMPRGVRIHAERAAAHFDDVRSLTGSGAFCGLDMEALRARSLDLASNAEALLGDSTKRVEVVFAFKLEPDR